MDITTASLRTEFLEFIFSDFPGYLCFATQEPFERATFKQFFFPWPGGKSEIESFLDLQAQTKNVWFCVNLLDQENRRKEYCLPANIVWADLDAINPNNIEPRPQVVIESSPGRFQAIWRVDQTLQPYAAEEYSRRIAYGVGADKSGWDLTQLLRMPFTKNLKYVDAPQVELRSVFKPMLSIDVFENLDAPPPTIDTVTSDFPMPDLDTLPEIKLIGYKYSGAFKQTGLAELLTKEPIDGDDWSVTLWRILRLCFESGCTRDEVFSLALNGNYNKYKRDGRSVTYLWRDVCKAELQQKKIEILVGAASDTFTMPELVTDWEDRTIIDDYTDWATTATDAVPVFHPLCCMMILASIMAGNLKLETSYGTMHPHLWGLVLGNSTLSRKTTAMNLATSFISNLDRETIIATDGSVEGILTGMSIRNGQTSMFFRDEVTGLFEAFKKKEYMSGMPEMFTQLYDSPAFFTRRLRKETISIISPIFMFFGGGIRDKFYELIDESMILSGFLPRFLIVSGDANINDVRVTQAPTIVNNEARRELAAQFANLWETYHKVERVEILGQKTDMTQMFEVILTQEAWDKYAEIEIKMIEAAGNTNFQMLSMPTFERLSRSLLKIACLLAAARQQPIEGLVQCTLTDINNAAKYIQEWGNCSIDMLQNCEKSVAQRILDKILARITAQPGVLKGELMRNYSISARDMLEIERTLEQRGQILIVREGKGVHYTTV